MLSPSDLAGMRATAQTALPDTVRVQRRTKTSDNAGGYTETWADVVTVAGRLTSVQDEEREAGGQIRRSARPVVVVPNGTDVRNADRLVIGSRTFYVTGVAEGGAWEVERQVLVEERG